MTTAINATMRAREWGYIFILSVLWGGSFFFIEVALQALPPLTIVLCRVGLAACALWLVVFAWRLPPPNAARVWASFLFMGFFSNALPFSLIVWGQTQITGGLASILNATTPLFTVLIAAITLADERLTPGKIVGVALGMGGTTVMIGYEALAGAADNVPAMLAVLAATLSYGIAITFGRRYRAWGVHPVTAAAGQVSAATLLLLPLALALEAPLQFIAAPPPAQVAAAVVGLAVFSTALAFVLYFHVLATAGATNISLVTFLVPVSAILLGYLILDETLQLSHIAGMALIALGLVVIDGRAVKALKSR